MLYKVYTCHLWTVCYENAGNKKPTLGTNEIGNANKNIELANYNLIVDGSPFNKGDVKLTTRRALLKREAS